MSVTESDPGMNMELSLDLLAIIIAIHIWLRGLRRSSEDTIPDETDMDDLESLMDADRDRIPDDKDVIYEPFLEKVPRPGNWPEDHFY